MSNLLKLLGFLTIINVFGFDNSSVINRFKNWIDEHQIQTDNNHYLAHLFENWLDNDKFIEQTNSMNLTYTLGHNAYSGMNSEEFAEFMGLKDNQYLLDQNNVFLRGNMFTTEQDEILNSNTLPSSIDWRMKNAVTPIKSQGSCGSCWSFSTTGALEGAYAIKYGNLLSFSEQQLVDCDNGLTKDHGCNGGLMDSAFQWISQNGGLCTEQNYPYVSGKTQKAGTCQTNCISVSGSKILKYTDVSANSDNAMMTALTQQPVSVAIEADQKSFQMYKSGVFQDSNCGTNLDHGVLLVGYGSTNGQDYYILKNSWDISWGMQGYMNLGRGNDPNTGKPFNNGAGQCGVLGMASYPTI